MATGLSPIQRIQILKVRSASILIAAFCSLGVVGQTEVDVDPFVRVEFSLGGSIDLKQDSNPRVEYEVIEGEKDRVEVVVHDGTLKIRNKGPSRLFRIREWFVEPATIQGTIYYDELTHLSALGSGDINAEVIKASEFNVSVVGSGDISIDELDTILCNLLVIGSGDISVDEIDTKTLDLNIVGSGGIEVMYAESRKIQSNQIGSGDVTLRGGSVDGQEITVLSSGNYRADSVDSETATTKLIGSGDIRIRVSDSIRGKLTGSGSVRYRGNPELDVEVNGSGLVQEM